ncbi:asparagine synthase (glutamine-hydrolyzing) [candidate division KSB1 bacterium]|nr:asparagine synthase (glutamine-hydrolyzing) [candidate division KSB1 bacterium]
MCGICGMVFHDANTQPDKDLLSGMNQTLVHRGPDQQGVFISSGIGLGIQRLAIIDLNTGDQPIRSENGKIVVVCNGEIYNAPELRETLAAKGHVFKSTSDVEVIVHLYEQVGLAFLDHLRGMFAFALWDAHQKQLILARDRFGIKPLYYALLPDALYFASEQKALLEIPALSHRVDTNALSELITLGFVASPRTLFADIRRLPHAHYLLFDRGQIQIKRYWSLNLLPDEKSIPVHDLVRMIDEKLSESVRIHTRSDVPVAAWLSGGLDSSAIVSYMLSDRTAPLDVYSLSYEDKSVDEFDHQRTLLDYSEYAINPRKVVCRDRDFQLFPQAIWHCEDPFTAAAEVSRLVLARASGTDYKVVLTGEGADEVFAGYPWYAAEKRLRYFNLFPLSIRRLVAQTPGLKQRFPGAAQILEGPAKMGYARFSRLIGPIHGYPLLPGLLSTRLREEMQNNYDQPFAPEYRSALLSLQHLDINLRLSDCIVQHLDRMTMACSLEARVPFLDHEFVELCTQIPLAQRYRVGKEKWLLREAVRNKIPDEIRMRKKYSMTTPFQKWLKGDLPEFARFMYSPKMIEEKGYFDAKTVNVMLKNYREGKNTHARILMAVLGVQVWDELFIQRRALQ